MPKKTVRLSAQERRSFKIASEQVRNLIRTKRKELWDSGEYPPESVGVDSQAIAHSVLLQARALLLPHQSVVIAAHVRKLVYEVNQSDTGEEQDVRKVRFATPLFDGVGGLPPWICVRRDGAEGYKPIRDATPRDLMSAIDHRREMAEAHYAIRDKLKLVVDTAKMRGCDEDEPVGKFFPRPGMTGSA